MAVLLWVGVVLLLVVAGALVFPEILLDPWFRRMLHPPVRVPRALPARMAARAEDVTVPGGSAPIKAWLVWPEAGRDEGSGSAPPRQPPAVNGIAVFIHGWSSDGGRMAPLAAHALDAGVACLLVDLPGHGRTGRTRTYNAKLMIEDLGAVRAWIAGREDLAGLRSAILGYSFGGVGAIVTAVRDRRWDALVVMATPVGPMQAMEIYLEGKGVPVGWIRGALRRTAVRVIGVDPEVYAGTRHLPELRVPALFVHGGLDEVVPCQHGSRLHASAPPGLAEIAIVDGAGHDGLLVDGEAGRHVAGFLARVLAEAPNAVRGERR